MANFAYVEDNTVKETCDILPTNWKNISNLPNLLNYPAELDALGWKTVVKNPYYFNPATQKIVDYSYTVIDGVVYEEPVIENLPTPVPSPGGGGGGGAAPLPPEVLEYENKQFQWSIVRSNRDQFMKDFEWRYNRYYRHERLSLPQLDTLKALDAHMSALADITLQEDPFNIIWPVYVQPEPTTTTSTTTSTTTTEAPVI
jgi:hypothetical protein